VRRYRKILGREYIWGRVSRAMSIAGEKGSERRTCEVPGGRMGVGRDFPKTRRRHNGVNTG
jgi:hypothetical protein